MRHCITAEFSLNTPLFSSGADPNIPELRVSEIKAALRFWWRAMNYALVGPTGTNEQLAEQEGKLFGSTTGQSPFLLRLRENKVDTLRCQPATALVTSQDLKYLGYGLTEPTATPRSGFKESADSTFTLELVLRPSAVPFQLEYINALKIFGLFGGLGYRSRRGFGSVTLQKLHVQDVLQLLPSQHNAHHSLFSNVLADCPIVNAAPAYSAFVNNRKFFRVVVHDESFSTGLAALESIARKFKLLLTARTGDLKRRLQNGNEVAKDDVSWAYMGLPRAYASKENVHIPKILPARGEREGVQKPSELIRRASPLVFHIHKAGAGDYRVIATLFKARFLPHGFGVADGSGRGNPVALPVPASKGYDWIDTWLNTIGNDIAAPVTTP